ncbi:MAG: ATP-binding cassette domain-containing protein [Deltaproteobacteria bacterium]|nr:ATP-binding cassette domain-containing protein [Deltaproteobacteria bacterium]
MLEVKDLIVEVGNFSLGGINLEVKKHDYFVILGPNGSGKTVLLEAIAGLRKIKKGSILLGGKDITNVPPEHRNVGYVPQDCVLFPFLDVQKNIEFGLRMRKYSDGERKKKVRFLSEILGIEHLLNRDIRTLSGGEKQKVAIARALALAPDLLLLDEPLSNLDISTSKIFRVELKRLHKELGLTTIHVTHNLGEAEELAVKIAIINSGRVEQVGSPHEIFFFPKSGVVSKFVGVPNILDVDHVRPIGSGLCEVSLGGIRLLVPQENNNIKKIALSSRDIYVSVDKPPGPEVNRVKGTILEIEDLSSIINMKVRVGDHILVVELPRETFRELNLHPQKEVFLIFKLRRLRTYTEEA